MQKSQSVIALAVFGLFLGVQAMLDAAETGNVHVPKGDIAWFREARWGVFFHYLASPASSSEKTGMSIEEWNGRINAFDVEGLAKQLQEVKAGYFFITLGQNSGYYLSPNATYDRLVGHEKSHCSCRDLVKDLATALNPRGIRLMVYFTASAPAQDRQAIEKLRCTPPWDARRLGFNPATYTAQPGVDERMTDFQRNWESVIREWSLRWGKDVHGWWIDGAYQADIMYRRPDPPNFESFAAAMKAGNPESIICFNPGVKVPVIKHAACEDYTAGEIADAFPVGVNAGSWSKAVGGQVQGAQYHILTFLGDYWGRGSPRMNKEMFVGYTRYINDCGGVITWDIPPAENGLIPGEFLTMLRALEGASHQ